LSLLSYLPEIISAGVDSLKIEGRMKSLHYLAGTVRTYRAAIDAYLAAPQDFALKDEWLRELDLVSHRPYTAGFFPGEAKEPMQVYGSSSYLRKAEFVGVVRDYDPISRMAAVEQRGVLRVGDKIEIMQPTQGDFAQTIDVMYDDGGNSIERAPHAQQSLKIPLDRPAEPYAILRREV
jgi:putative protease